MENSPKLIVGGVHSDERGRLMYVNDFDMRDVKRFYCIEQNAGIVRAWQGHMNERKWFLVTRGYFTIVYAKVSNWGDPPIISMPQVAHMKAQVDQVFFLPGGYVNGIKSQEDGSQLFVFSDMTVEESKTDDYRFSKSIWINWEDL